MDQTPLPPPALGTIQIMPLGGCGEFGMNVTAYRTPRGLFLIDCGLSFPDPHLLGVDAVIPSLDDFFAVCGRPRAYLLTHAHEDHVGALPHVLATWPAPVIGTPWTIEIVRHKLMKNASLEVSGLQVVQPGGKVDLDGCEVEFVPVNHSVPMACALVVRGEGATIFHSGDFKMSPSDSGGSGMDRSRLAALGDRGVDLLLADSTNAEKSGVCPPESAVYAPLAAEIENCPGAVFMTTFSSNLHRLRTIVKLCERFDRRLVVCGPSLELTIATAERLGLFSLPAGLRVGDDGFDALPRRHLLVLASGCQGEWRSAMARIAQAEYRGIRVVEGDRLIVSARVIPGNEKQVLKMVNGFRAQGASVVTTAENPSIHASGHAHGDDIRELLELLRPRNFIPVHGTIGQLIAGHRIAAEVRRNACRIERAASGDGFELAGERLRKIHAFEIAPLFVDAEAGIPMTYEQLRDRLRIGESGGVFISGVYSVGRRAWTLPPHLTLAGIRLPEAIDRCAWLAKTIAAVTADLDEAVTSGERTEEGLGELARLSFRRRFQEVLKKKPVVLIHFKTVR